LVSTGHLLPVGNLEGQVRGDRVGELGIVLNLLDDADYFGRQLLVEFHVALELGGGRARLAWRIRCAGKIKTVAANFTTAQKFLVNLVVR
jgi:hypothetical protein